MGNTSSTEKIVVTRLPQSQQVALDVAISVTTDAESPNETIPTISTESEGEVLPQVPVVVDARLPKVPVLAVSTIESLEEIPDINASFQEEFFEVQDLDLQTLCSDLECYTSCQSSVPNFQSCNDQALTAFNGEFSQKDVAKSHDHQVVIIKPSESDSVCSELSCCVCYLGPKDGQTMAEIDCKHPVCNDCALKMKTSNCPICRAPTLYPLQQAAQVVQEKKEQKTRKRTLLVAILAFILMIGVMCLVCAIPREFRTLGKPSNATLLSNTTYSTSRTSRRHQNQKRGGFGR